MSETTARNASNLIRFGVIAEVDPATARVRVQSGDILTDWLPWLVPCAGGRIVWATPSVGEQVLLVSVDGELSGGVAVGSLYSDQFAAPGNQANKHHLQFRDGAIVEYDDDVHALVATLPAGGTAAVSAPGGLTINADVTINGTMHVTDTVTADSDINCNATVTGATDCVGGGKSLKGHKHTGVQSGSAVSGPPQ